MLVMARSRRPGREWRDAGIGSLRRHRQARLHMLCALACVIGAAPLMALVLGRIDRKRTVSLSIFAPQNLVHRRGDPKSQSGVAGPISPAQHLIGGDGCIACRVPLRHRTRGGQWACRRMPPPLHSTLPALNSSTKAARLWSKGEGKTPRSLSRMVRCHYHSPRPTE